MRSPEDILAELAEDTAHLSGLDTLALGARLQADGAKKLADGDYPRGTYDIARGVFLIVMGGAKMAEGRVEAAGREGA